MKTKSLLRILTLLIIAVLILTGCALGNTSKGISKEPGTGRGVVSNIDPLNNGLFQVWIFGDNTYVYCTTDVKLVEQVKSIMLEKDATMIYTYRDWLSTDSEYTTRDANGNLIYLTCGQGYTGTHGSKLLTAQPISKQ